MEIEEVMNFLGSDVNSIMSKLNLGMDNKEVAVIITRKQASYYLTKEELKQGLKTEFSELFEEEAKEEITTSQKLRLMEIAYEINTRTPNMYITEPNTKEIYNKLLKTIKGE